MLICKQLKAKTLVFTFRDYTMKHILLLLSILSFSYTNAQQVSGTVSDEKNQAMAYANVIRYALPDSTFVDGTTTEDDGSFSFKDKKEGSYYLKVMMLGYKDYFTESFEAGSAPLFEIKISTDAEVLDEISIVAKKPLIEQTVDRLVVNVADNVTGADGNLLDVLQRVPGVLVVNDQLSMAGSGSPTILIDGRTTEYMDIETLLKEMPGDNIEKIEVIHQPGAEFDAQGTGPVINIILKKNKLYGTNGSISVGLGRGFDWRRRIGLSLNSRQGKWNFYGSGGYSKNYYYEELNIDRTLDNIEYIQRNLNPSIPSTWRASGGVDFYINDRQTVGFSVNGVHSLNVRDNINTTILNYSTSLESDTLVTTNSLDRKWAYLNNTAYYSIELDTSGQRLDLDFNAAFFDVRSDADTRTLVGGEPQTDFADQRTRRPGKTAIYAAKVDYTKPVGKTLKFQTGAKYSFADLDNDLRTEYFDSGNWLLNPLQTNHFLFEESIYAGYGKVTYGGEKWNLTGGLRYEASYSDGYSITLDSTTNRTIKQFFPSASIGREITNNIGVVINYSYRIDRPRYSSLNPFLYFIDPFTYETGNPFLRPELTHSSKLSVTYEKQPFFNLEYAKTKDVITLITEQDTESGVTFAYDDNLSDFTKYGGSLFLPLDPIKGLGGYAGVMTYYNEYSNPEVAFDQGAWTFTGFLQANYTLPLDIKAELSGWYTSGGQDGIIQFEEMFGLSGGLQKKFLDEDLTVKLSANNFVTKFFTGSLDYDNTVANINSVWDAPVYQLKLTYKFGNQYLDKSEKRKGSASDIINRAQED